MQTEGPSPRPAALVLTNFAFGRGAYVWGLLDPKLRWSSGRVLVAVVDWTSHAGSGLSARFHPGAPSIRRSDLGRFEGFPFPVGHRFVRAGGRLLEIWVEARPLTTATLAAANRQLAGVTTCSP